MRLLWKNSLHSCAVGRGCVSAVSCAMLVSLTGCQFLPEEDRRVTASSRSDRIYFGNANVATEAPGSPRGGVGWHAASADGRVWVDIEASEQDIDIEGTGFELDALRPEAAENFVFVPNPDGRHVVVVDSKRLLIRTVETGLGPTYLSTLPGADAALVINVRSEDMSLVRIAGDGQASELRLPMVEGANRMAIAPDGQSAVVFFDVDQATLAEGDVQAVSVLHLGAGEERSTVVTVGFKPERVVYTADSSRAFVISEGSIAILDFERILAEGPGLAPQVTFDVEGILRAEMVVTSDGAYAVGYLPGRGDLRVLRLDSGEEIITPLWNLFLPEDLTQAQLDALAELEPGDPPPDWALPRVPAISALHYDPGADYLLAAVADYHSIVRVPIGAGFSDLRLADARDIGSAADTLVGIEDVERVLAFRSDEGSHLVTVVDYTDAGSRSDAGPPEADSDAGPPEADSDAGLPEADVAERGGLSSERLLKGIAEVHIAPDGEHAVIVHDHSKGDPRERGLSVEEALRRSPGHTLIDLRELDTKLELTDATVDEVVFSSDSRYAFLLFDDPSAGDAATAVREVHRVNLSTFVTESVYLLDSPPVGGAAVPGQTRVYITQAHRDGRLTFIDWENGEVETVTGLELNSRIQN